MLRQILLGRALFAAQLNELGHGREVHRTSDSSIVAAAAAVALVGRVGGCGDNDDFLHGSGHGTSG